jgi:hypothetical protein
MNRFIIKNVGTKFRNVMWMEEPGSVSCPKWCYGYRGASTFWPEIYPWGHLHHRFHSSENHTSIYIQMLPKAHTEIFNNMIYCRTVLPSDVTSVHELSNRNTRLSITDTEEMRRRATFNSITVEKRRYATHGSRIGCVDEEESEYVWWPDINWSQTRFHIGDVIHFSRLSSTIPENERVQSQEGRTLTYHLPISHSATTLMVYQICILPNLLQPCSTTVTLRRM